MPHWCRIRLGNRFGSLGSRLWDCSDNSRPIDNVRANVPRFVRAPRSLPEESHNALSFGQDEYQRHRHSAVRAGMDGAGGSCVN
jgi:hypothetical protein